MEECAKPFLPPKPDGWSSASSGTTLQSTTAGSIWAESELGVLLSQCLDRCIPDQQTLIDEIAAWENDRNANYAKANWHFTTPNARINSSIHTFNLTESGD